MKTLENENEKVNRICEILRKETLEPAEKKAQGMLEEAKAQADEIIRHAEKEAEEILESAKLKIAQERKVFQSSLAQGAKQSLEMLRQEIVQNLFNPALEQLIQKKLATTDTIASIIDALVHAIKSSGFSGDLQAYIPKNISPDMVNSLLLKEVLNTLEKHSVEIGNFNGGAQVKLVNKNMRLDMTDAAIKELIAQFVREDLRKIIFGA